MWNKRAFPHGEMKMTNEDIEESAKWCLELWATPESNVTIAAPPDLEDRIYRAIRELVVQAFDEAAQTAKTLEVRCSDCGGMNEHDICETANGEAIASAILALRDSLVETVPS
jgi:hypothetical protein